MFKTEFLQKIFKYAFLSVLSKKLSALFFEGHYRQEGVNPSNANATRICPKHKDTTIFWKPSKPCHAGVHLIAVPECSQMSTHLPVFQSFLRFFASFCIGQISYQQHIRVKDLARQNQLFSNISVCTSVIFQVFCIILHWPN